MRLVNVPVGEDMCVSTRLTLDLRIQSLRIIFVAQTYGLIAPGIEMADILAFNLTQTASHAPRKMNDPDLSTKLKLMGGKLFLFNLICLED
jgi:hypothetical protein